MAADSVCNLSGRNDRFDCPSRHPITQCCMGVLNVLRIRLRHNWRFLTDTIEIMEGVDWLSTRNNEERLTLPIDAFQVAPPAFLAEESTTHDKYLVACQSKQSSQADSLPKHLNLRKKK